MSRSRAGLRRNKKDRQVLVAWAWAYAMALVTMMLGNICIKRISTHSQNVLDSSPALRAAAPGAAGIFTPAKSGSRRSKRRRSGSKTKLPQSMK
jgi:hypothetical protein